MNGQALPKNCTDAVSLLANPELFKVLSDPTRLAVLIRLARASSPLTVSQASECCGVHLSGVSRHLKTLREAGLVEAVKSGREVVYRPRLAQFVATLRGMADALESGAFLGEECCREKGDSHDHGE